MFNVVENKKLALLEMTIALGSTDPALVCESGLLYDDKEGIDVLARNMAELSNPYPLELVATILKMYEDDLINIEEFTENAQDMSNILTAYYGLPQQHRLMAPYLVHYTAIDEVCQKAKRSSSSVEHIGSMINFILTTEEVKKYLGERGEDYFGFTLKDIEEYTKALITGRYVTEVSVIQELSPEEHRRLYTKLHTAK